MKLLTDLQILDCELHKNAFPARTRYGEEGGKRKEKVGNREGREGEDIKG